MPTTKQAVPVKLPGQITIIPLNPEAGTNGAYPSRNSLISPAIPGVAWYRGNQNPVLAANSDMQDGDLWLPKPPAPVISITNLVISAGQADFRINVTTPVSGATKYIAEIATDNKFKNHIAAGNYIEFTGTFLDIADVPLATYYVRVHAVVAEELSDASKMLSTALQNRYNAIKNMVPAPQNYWKVTDASLTVMVDEMANQNGVYEGNPANVSAGQGLDPARPAELPKRFLSATPSNARVNGTFTLPATGLVLRGTIKGTGGGDTKIISLGNSAVGATGITLAYAGTGSKKLQVFMRSDDATPLIVNTPTAEDVFDDVLIKRVCLILTGSNIVNTVDGPRNWFLLLNGVQVLAGAYCITTPGGIPTYTHKVVTLDRLGLGGRQRAAMDQRMTQCTVQDVAIWRGATIPSRAQMIEEELL